MRTSAVIFFVLLSACAGARTRRQGEMYENLRTLAASDLDCEPQEVTLIPVSEHAIEVVGCDRRATYTGEGCTGRSSVDGCTWARSPSSP
jgi:hypothetical protein